jgi:hypothetical protein
VLALKPADLMERRLQTQVFKLGLAKSIHHARVLIRAPARPKFSRPLAAAGPDPHARCRVALLGGLRRAVKENCRIG